MKKGYTLMAALILGFTLMLTTSRIMGSINKAQELIVQEDIRVYAASTEHVYKASRGTNTELKNKLDILNNNLEDSHKFEEILNHDVDNSLIGISQKKDPWGEPYRIELTSYTDDEGILVEKIYLKSYGKSHKSTNKINNNEVQPDIVMLTQYYNSKVRTCSLGIGHEVGQETNNIDNTGKIIDFTLLDCFE